MSRLCPASCVRLLDARGRGRVHGLALFLFPDLAPHVTALITGRLQGNARSCPADGSKPNGRIVRMEDKGDQPAKTATARAMATTLNHVHPLRIPLELLPLLPLLQL